MNCELKFGVLITIDKEYKPQPVFVKNLDLLVKYNGLRSKMMANKNNLISISEDEVKLVAKCWYLKGSMQKDNGIDYTYAMGTADTFFRALGRKDKHILINGYTYHAGEVNYIGVGAVNAGYDKDRLRLLPAVTSWNVGQYIGFVERVGTYAPGFLQTHNITSIPNNYFWAFVGQYYGEQ